MSLPWAVGGFGLCALVILIAGPFLAEAAGVLAEKTGLGTTFVGTTLVALSTSLPELVATIAALRMGSVDLAVGNVFGSNAFNMILLAPLDVIHSGSLLAAVSARHTVTCLAVVLATQVAIIGQLYQAESRLKFIEPDAWLIVAIVVGALALVYYLP
jgi:cation:H+ antiporter